MIKFKQTQTDQNLAKTAKSMTSQVDTMLKANKNASKKRKDEEGAAKKAKKKKT